MSIKGCLSVGGDQGWSLDLFLLCHRFPKSFGQLILYSFIFCWQHEDSTNTYLFHPGYRDFGVFFKVRVRLTFVHTVSCTMILQAQLSPLGSAVIWLVWTLPSSTVLLYLSYRTSSQILGLAVLRKYCCCAGQTSGQTGLWLSSPHACWKESSWDILVSGGVP